MSVETDFFSSCYECCSWLIISWVGLIAFRGPLLLELAGGVFPNPALDLGLDISNPLNDLLGQALDPVDQVVVVDVVVLHVDGDLDSKD